MVKPPQNTFVYLIDGDAAVRDSLTVFGETIGTQVHCFGTHSAFRRAFESTLPACVICAAQLPDSDGLKVHSEVRARCPNLPFALLLSAADVKLRERARAAGIEHIIRKPLVNQQLRQFIHEVTAGSPGS